MKKKYEIGKNVFIIITFVICVILLGICTSYATMDQNEWALEAKRGSETFWNLDELGTSSPSSPSGTDEYNKDNWICLAHGVTTGIDGFQEVRAIVDVNIHNDGKYSTKYYDRSGAPHEITNNMNTDDAKRLAYYCYAATVQGGAGYFDGIRTSSPAKCALYDFYQCTDWHDDLPSLIGTFAYKAENTRVYTTGQTFSQDDVNNIKEKAEKYVDTEQTESSATIESSSSSGAKVTIATYEGTTYRYIGPFKISTSGKVDSVSVKDGDNDCSVSGYANSVGGEVNSSISRIPTNNRNFYIVTRTNLVSNSVSVTINTVGSAGGGTIINPDTGAETTGYIKAKMIFFGNSSGQGTAVFRGEIIPTSPDRDSVTLTAENNLGKLKVQKIGAYAGKGSYENVTGLGFKLYRLEGTTKKYLRINDKDTIENTASVSIDGTTSYSKSKSNATTIYTHTNGLITIDNISTAYEYYLEEVDVSSVNYQNKIIKATVKYGNSAEQELSIDGNTAGPITVKLKGEDSVVTKVVLQDYRKSITLEVEKVDSVDNSIKLGGVTFRLYNTDTKKYVIATEKSEGVYKISDPLTAYTEEKEQATTFITEATNGSCTIEGIDIGNYKFVEIYNPNYGYTKKVTKSQAIYTAQYKWTIENEKEVGELDIEKIDDRNSDKKLPGVEFAIRSSLYPDKYIKVKATGDNVTNDNNGWATKIVGTSSINDTNQPSDPTIQYTSNIDEATRFVTDDEGKICIKNLLMSSNGSDEIKYQLQEIANPNYGYIIDYETDWIELNRSNPATYTAKNHQEYIRIEGYVWEEIAVSKSNFVNNLYNETDALVEGINVYLCKDGKIVATTVTDSNGWYEFGTHRKDGETYTNEDYLTAENGNLLIKDLDKYYVEFEYDGLRFTSVEAIVEYLNDDYNITSKATETPSGRNDREDRQSVNEDFYEITNGAARNNDQEVVYELKYDFEDHVSTYIDYWGYEYNEDKTKLKVTPAKYYEIIASTQISGFSLKSAWEARCEDDGAEVLTGINLGIQRRAQADLAVSTDISDLNVIVQNYENTYTYESRKDYTDQNVSEEDSKYDAAKDGFGVDVKFGSKYTSSYSNRGLKMYTRRIYESDLALYNQTYDTNKDLMQIYVTYKTTLKNQSGKLTSTVNELVNYYDSRYTIADSWIKNGDDTIQIGAEAWSNISKYQNSYSDEDYTAIYTQAMSEIKISPNEKIDVYIKFRLKPEAVKALIEKQSTLNNVSEITSFSTMKQTNNMFFPYAAIDEDSNPGSVKSIVLGENKTVNVELNNRNYSIETKTLNEDDYEDDTDAAPSLVLGIEESDPTRGLSGTVFEDEDALHDDDDTHPGEERLGDGILYTGEGEYRGAGANEKVDKNRISGAKVELLEYDENTADHIAYNPDGTAKVATLYKLSVNASGELSTTTEQAVTSTDANGEYQFVGVNPGRYLIRYTYDNNCYITDSAGNQLEQINVRDYKSTVITSDLMKVALNLNKNYSSEDERMGDLNWILKYDDVPNNGNYTTDSRSKSKDWNTLIRYSDATDDVSKRDEMDDLYYGSYGNNYEMTADTALFDVGVEYSEVSESSDGFADRISYTNYSDEYNLEGDKILVLDENGRLKVADRFYAVNPYQDFGITERARQDYEINKRVSNLEIKLANGQILISGNPYKQLPDSPTDIDDYWNNLEASSDDPLPYVKALPGQVTVEIDNEIIQNAKLSIEYTITIRNKSEKDFQYKENQEYYYYGTNGQDEIKTAVRKVVDYMEADLDYDDERNEALGWMKITPEELKEWTRDTDNNSKQLISDEVYEDIKQGYTVAVTEKFYGDGQGIGTGQIASEKIYGKKSLYTSEEGISVENHTEIIETMGIRAVKSSVPGNYSPKTRSPHEPDDDMTKVIITGPTGLLENKIFIISATAIALVVLAGGIYLIKKKVL